MEILGQIGLKLSSSVSKALLDSEVTLSTSGGLESWQFPAASTQLLKIVKVTWPGLSSPRMRIGQPGEGARRGGSIMQKT